MLKLRSGLIRSVRANFGTNFTRMTTVAASCPHNCEIVAAIQESVNTAEANTPNIMVGMQLQR